MRRSAASSLSCFSLLAVALLLTACGPPLNRYALIEQSLLAGDAKQADAIVRQAEESYGSKSRLLYGMDRGMMLQLAGDYQQSNAVLEQADEEIERLYTRSIRSETAAFLTNDNTLPYEGDAYEHVMINVLKALNYAAQGQLEESLVEARRIDHRLNVLSDKVNDKATYREDGFARYLTGILYESAGDINNAFIAYRKAYEAYEAMSGWARTPAPGQLRADLLRTSEALHLTTEFEEYRRLFPDTTWRSYEAVRDLAQVVLISYNGRAPRKEDRYLDLPVSLNALQLVLLNRGFSQGARQQNRGVDSVLYGLSGRVVRVALPQLISHKTHVAAEQLMLTDDAGRQMAVRSELGQNITALAEKSLADRLPGIAMKAVARAAGKFAMAEGATRGAQQAAGKDAGPWVGLIVGVLTKGWAVASEEADKRSWQTLPDEIHITRAWVAPGRYQASVQLVGRGESNTKDSGRTLTLVPGQTTVLIQRVMQ
ncbi:COG3014 family protein [Nitrospira sp. NS4]|uniref:COG3014 family protein n=1 Tax=Nitrospira sp. NS4 TaxID=3414498 RepID=UPI003C2C30DD